MVKEKQHWWAGFISDVGYSLRWVWRYPIIRRLFLVDIAFKLATFFLVTAMDISLALRGEPGLIIGIVSTCFSAGLLVGGVIADRIRARWNDGRLVIGTAPAVAAALAGAVVKLVVFQLAMLFLCHLPRGGRSPRSNPHDQGFTRCGPLRRTPRLPLSSHAYTTTQHTAQKVIHNQAEKSGFV